MGLTATVALLLVLLGLTLALRQAMCVERRLQKLLQTQTQRLTDLQQKLTQLHAAHAQIASAGDRAPLAVATTTSPDC
jgi:hypothetical protein